MWFSGWKLPVKLSLFHKQVLLCWKLMYTHNFTPHQTPIWNDRYVLRNGKSLYLQHWMERNIWSVTHLVNDQGYWISYENFCTKYDIVCTCAQFDKVIKAIPDSIRLLVQNIDKQLYVIELPRLHFNDNDFLAEGNSNKLLRYHLNESLYPIWSNRNSIIQLFSDLDIKKWRTNYITYLVSPKTREVHFKILNNIYPSNELLRLRFNVNHNNCCFCDNEIETTDHLFFHCVYSATFWEDLQDWLSTKILYSSQEKILYLVITWRTLRVTWY